MTANQIFLVIFVPLFIGTLALQAAMVRWGLRWANIASVSYLKAFGLYLLFWTFGSLLGACAGIAFFGLSNELPDQTWNIIGVAALLIAASLAITAIYKTRLLKAAQASLPFTAASISIVLLTFYVIRPFAYESFLIPTNAMAPTILGDHLEAPCPRCGHPAYGAPPDPRMPLPAAGVLMNCSAERRAVYVTDIPTTVFEGDRILVCKLIKPRRWDLIVFRYPANPDVNYVKRLVGLPNEELSIHDGAVWINGEKVDPPESILGIHYSPTIEANGRVYSGPGSVPLKLGSDEYFVLGDFPEQSADSRMWENGAPGYPPYAVPESHLTGIAINIFWPPRRWISFR